MQDGLVHSTITVPANTKNRHFVHTAAQCGAGAGTTLQPPSVASTHPHTPFTTKPPPKVVVVSVYETKLEVNGAGDGNTLKSDGHLKFCPLGHIQLFSALREPSFKIPIGNLPPRQDCAAWQISTMCWVREQPPCLVDQRKLHVYVWATARCVAVTIHTHCKSYLRRGGGGGIACARLQAP